MTTDGQVQETNAPTETAPKPQATKVFVGNLSFKTRTKSLREAFSQFGRVEGARVVTQGRRSLGYGFVQFATVEEAKNAVEKLHQTELEERKINVEISTSLNSKVNPKKRPPRKHNRKPRIPSGDQDSSPKQTPVTINPVPSSGVKRSSRPPFRPKKQNNTKSEPSNKNEVTEDIASPAPSKTNKRKKRPNKPKHQRRERIPPSQREYSETVIYVSNIPFELGDEDLKNYFAEFNAVSANVILRKNNDKNKGFGFVTFDKPENQARAVEEYSPPPKKEKENEKDNENDNEKKKPKKLVIKGREITVRKAHLRPEKPLETQSSATEPLANKSE